MSFLLLSVGRTEMHQTTLSAKQLVRNMLTDLSIDTEGQSIDWRDGDSPEICGGFAMLQLVLEYLMSDAVKYMSTRDRVIKGY
jgi:hypothetical protein